LTQLIIALAAFVGTHFALSHPLRDPLSARLGELRFRGLYTLISLATFGWAVWAYGEIGRQAPLWTASETIWIAAAVLMWVASVLLFGSFFGNPALPGAPRADRPRGVLAITRHPMMWSFAIWAIVHAALIATPKALLLDGAILFLALAGAAGQDVKKRRRFGDKWGAWVAQTSFLPFGKGLVSPGVRALIGGTVLYLLATWLHPINVGVWR
jgi:uncharacterized membrane protein